MDHFKSDFLALAVQSRAVVFQQQQQQQMQQQKQRGQEPQAQQQQDHEIYSGSLQLSPEAYVELRAGLQRAGVDQGVTTMERRLLPGANSGLVFPTAFALTFFHEIRERVCGGEDKEASDLAGTTAQGLATGVATWLMGSFGIANPMALGIAATVLFVLAGAGRGTFCKMTEQEVRANVGLAR